MNNAPFWNYRVKMENLTNYSKKILLKSNISKNKLSCSELTDWENIRSLKLFSKGPNKDLLALGAWKATLVVATDILYQIFGINIEKSGVNKDRVREDTGREDVGREDVGREDIVMGNMYREGEYREGEYGEDEQREGEYMEDDYGKDERRDDDYREDDDREDEYGEAEHREDEYGEAKHREDEYGEDEHREDEVGEDEFNENMVGKELVREEMVNQYELGEFVDKQNEIREEEQRENLDESTDMFASFDSAKQSNSKQKCTFEDGGDIEDLNNLEKEDLVNETANFNMGFEDLGENFLEDEAGSVIDINEVAFEEAHDEVVAVEKIGINVEDYEPLTGGVLRNFKQYRNLAIDETLSSFEHETILQVRSISILDDYMKIQVHDSEEWVNMTVDEKLRDDIKEIQPNCILTVLKTKGGPENLTLVSYPSFSPSFSSSPSPFPS